MRADGPRAVRRVTGVGGAQAEARRKKITRRSISSPELLSNGALEM